MTNMTLNRSLDTRNSGEFPLAMASPAELGFHGPALDRLRNLIEGHIAQGCYPGAQIALARHGRLALF